MGFCLGLAALYSMQSTQYTADSAIEMSALPSTGSKISSGLFLKPMVKMQSLIQNPSLTSREKVEQLEKLEMAEQRDMLKKISVAGGLLAPHAAHAAMTPSLDNLLKSVYAGGFVATAILAAVVLVSQFDPIDRAA